MKLRHGWFVVVLLATMVAGCENAGRTIGIGSSGPEAVPEPDSLVAKSQPPMVDLPMPVSFDLKESRSRSMAAPGLRFVDHWYYGREDKWAVGRFFKRQMPAAQWQLQADRMMTGDIVLDFVKGRESCKMTIGENFWGTTTVHVEIYAAGPSVGAPK